MAHRRRSHHARTEPVEVVNEKENEMAPNWMRKFWKMTHQSKHRGIYTKKYADGRQKRRKQ